MSAGTEPSSGGPDHSTALDGGLDSGLDGAAPSPKLPPPPPFSGTFMEPTGEPGGCAFVLGAECDGSEDCPDGKVCCGSLDRGTLTYRSIACQASCDGADDYPLCHPGDTCERADRVCRGSSVLPYSFLSVCASASPTAAATTGEYVDEVVLCGDQRCDAGREQCCLAGLSAGPFGGTALEPYCAPVTQACECDRPDPGVTDAGEPVDGGMDATMAEPDAGNGDGDGGHDDADGGR